MKKIFTIVALTIWVWGCAKKMAPAKTIPPSSNTGSSISTNNETPASTVSNTPATSTQPVYTTSETLGSKTVVRAGTTSPEVLAQMAGQSTYNAKCGRCHGLKVTTDYTADRWASIMAVMANPSHANLSDTEKDNVMAYVRANSKK